jgi:adenylate cyclase
LACEQRRLAAIVAADVAGYSRLFGWSPSLPDSLVAIGEAARSAVLANDQDAFAHTALAIFELFSGHHDEAVRRLERVIVLNSNLTFPRGYLGVALAFSGEDAAAFRYLDEAIRNSARDPLLCIWHVAKSWASLAAGRFVETIEHAHHGIEIDPEFVDLYGVLAAAYGHLGEVTPAAAALEQYQTRMPRLIRNDPRLERPFKRLEDRERFIDGLAKAGLAG